MLESLTLVREPKPRLDAQGASRCSGLALRRGLLRDVIQALCAFLLLFGASWPACADEAKPLTTILILARSELPDSNFKDSVVVVMNNIAPAPVGLIVNRPTRILVSRLFPDLERVAQLDDKV